MSLSSVCSCSSPDFSVQSSSEMASLSRASYTRSTLSAANCCCCRRSILSRSTIDRLPASSCGMRICYRHVQGLTRELLILPGSSQAALCYMQTLRPDDGVARVRWPPRARIVAWRPSQGSAPRASSFSREAVHLRDVRFRQDRSPQLPDTHVHRPVMYGSTTSMGPRHAINSMRA